MTASQAGNSTYNAAPDGSRSFTIAKANQTIVVIVHAPLAATYGIAFRVAAVGGGSGNPIVYSSSGSCSNSGSTFTMTSGSGKLHRRVRPVRIRQAIEESTQEGAAVIVAHGASSALTDRDDVLRVLITASPETRSGRLVAAEQAKESEAAKFVAESDAARADYLKRFYKVGAADELRPRSEHGPDDGRGCGRARGPRGEALVAIRAAPTHQAADQPR